MIKIDWKKFVREHIITIQSNAFIREREWFGWWWASYCSAHQIYDKHCLQCNGGTWSRNMLFGKWTIRKHKIGGGKK